MSTDHQLFSNRSRNQRKLVIDKMEIDHDEVEATLKRIQTHPGVVGVIVTNPEGIPIRSSMDNATTQLYAASVESLASMARSAVRDIDPLNDLKFLRVRSKKHEIMVAPENNYSLIVIQGRLSNI